VLIKSAWLKSLSYDGIAGRIARETFFGYLEDLSMLRNDELLDCIGQLERANRIWKGLALGLAAALILILAVGIGLGFSLYFQTQNRRFEAEAAMQKALQQEVLARQRAQEAAEALKAAEKQKARP
jgi:hypothetical protein